LEQIGAREMPRDHDDLLMLARELKRRGSGYAYFPALDGSAPLENLVAMGAALFDPRCGPGFSNARGEHVFEFYQSLYREGLTPRNVVTEGHRKAVELFAAGQVAVIATGMQFLAAIRNANPRLYKEIRLAPQLNAPGVAPNIAAMNLAVTAASKQRDAAFALASFVTNPENQLAFARRVPILPSTRASYDDAFFQSTVQTDASRSGEGSTELIAQARALSVQQVLKGEVAVPPVRHYNKLRNSYARHLQATMLGRLSPAQGVQATAREWSSLLRCA
jgi:putative chitobiose transport system substrate-binding protein